MTIVAASSQEPYEGTVIQTHLSIHLWPTCWRFVTAGVQVEVLVFLPGIACSAAALRSAFPPWESALPADWEEGWGCSRERYCNKCGQVMKALSFKLLCNTHKSPWDVLKRENRVWYLLCIIFLFCYEKKKDNFVVCIHVVHAGF